MSEPNDATSVPEDSDEPTQKPFWIKQLRFSVSQMAPPSCMHRPNTSTSTRAPLPSVTH